MKNKFFSVFVIFFALIIFTAQNEKKEAPVIGICAGVYTIESGAYKGLERQYSSEGLIAKIERAGGVPVILPITEDEAVIMRQLEMIDAIIFTGGQDINPARYGEKETIFLGDVNDRRDSYEMNIFKAVREMKKPILGICRGEQLINVALGGTLYQDIMLKKKKRKTVRHNQHHSPETPAHNIKIKNKNLLFSILKSKTIKVNSFHHQAINSSAPGVIICAESDDGVIEAISDPAYPFLLGLQWHPELLPMNDQPSEKIFEAFIKAALKRGE